MTIYIRRTALTLIMVPALWWNGGVLFAGTPRDGLEYALPRHDGRPVEMAAAGPMEEPGVKKAGQEVEKKPLLEDLVPQQEEKIPLCSALAVDFIIPGGGALYHKNYYWGAAFGALKIAGAWAVYHYYQVWEYRRSLYNSARDANIALDPHHELRFRVPGEGYKTAGELRRDYDRAAQTITFAVIANLLVYAVSLYTTYHFVDHINERSIPAFELAVDRNGDRELTEYSLYCTFTHRM